MLLYLQPDTPVPVDLKFILKMNAAENIWKELMKPVKSMALKPCGLGARDTLAFRNGILFIWK